MDFRQGEVLKTIRSQVGTAVAWPFRSNHNEGGSWLINLRMQLFKQHQVFDRVVLPGASHLLLATAAHLRLNENASALELTDTIFECRGAWQGLGQSMVVWVGFTWSYKI